MRKTVLALMALGLIFIGCSKDDESNKNCESCEKAKICDNGDGTYTFSYDGAEEKVTQEELDVLKLTPKEFVELVCLAGNSE